MSEPAISPLRRRMIEDMTIRKFAQKTQHDYVRRVKEFASYLKRSPDTAKPEDVRGFQLHLTSSNAGTPKINATVAALRFFFRVTLDRSELGRHLPTIQKPLKLPFVLSPDEVACFLEAAPQRLRACHRERETSRRVRPTQSRSSLPAARASAATFRPILMRASTCSR